MFLNWFRRIPATPRLATRPFYSEEAFAAVLEHERMRMERTDRQFCLLKLTNGGERDELPLVLERIDLGAIRRTDAAGLYRDGVGVMLPETGAAGAKAVRRKLTEDTSIDCNVYIFPSEDLPELEDDDHRTENAYEPVEAGSNAARALDDDKAESLEGEMVMHSMGLKRTIDIVGAVCGLIVLSPIILTAMALVKLTSKGPVLFTQRRAGLGGAPFTIYKLRTMVVDAEEMQAALRDQSEQDGPAFKLKHDPRITSIGRFLRKSCIDELPQLWNVLMGDMSIVGPRPLPIGESAQISRWSRARLRVKPGLTCIWQVDGGRQVKFDDWMRMDIKYILERNTSSDLKLIVRTATKVLMHRAST